MSKTEYRRLGEYIKQVDVRNSSLEVDNLLGLSIEKIFIPSIANTIGADLSKYKQVAPMQFAYVPVTSRNGEKITVALYKGDETAIVSQAYTVFEITNTNLLHPDYLMLWFKRPEFDRYARFKSHGSAREVFDWEEMCSVILPVPSIEEQQKIVEQYLVIENRVRNNERLIAKLEDSAQTIFNHHFVENIDHNNLPEGWKMGNIDEMATLKVGGDKPKVFSNVKSEDCPIPIFSNGIVDKGLYGFTNKPSITENSVTISARGTIGVCFLRFSPYYSIVRLISVIPKNHKSLFYLFHILKHKNIKGDGSVQNQLTVPYLKTESFLIPPIKEQDIFFNEVGSIYEYISIIENEIEILKALYSTMISNLI